LGIITYKTKDITMDNQQRSLEEQGVKLIKCLGKRKNKYWGLYLCPQCSKEVELRKDGIARHYKLHTYPKLCSPCANLNAGQKRKQHGDIDTRLYSIWKNMKQRISNPNLPKAHLYYGKPLELSWKHYEGFKVWAMSSGYTDTLTIDRKDANRGYTADNCRWITLPENSSRAAIRSAGGANTKIPQSEIPKILSLREQGLTHREIAEKYDVSRTTITYILNKERSTTIPNGSTSQVNGDGSGVLQ
jgi:hypothetical protein